MRICVVGVADDVAAHLAKRLKQEGHHIIAIDVQPNKSMPSKTYCNEFRTLDVRLEDNCAYAVKDCDWVFSWPCKYADRLISGLEAELGDTEYARMARGRYKIFLTGR